MGRRLATVGLHVQPGAEILHCLQVLFRSFAFFHAVQQFRQGEDADAYSTAVAVEQVQQFKGPVFDHLTSSPA